MSPPFLARLRHARVVAPEETPVRVRGMTPGLRGDMLPWKRVLQDDDVVIHLVRNSRDADVVGEVLDGHRP